MQDNNNKRCIIGLTGLLASGKGTCAAYLEQTFGAKSYRFSTILRDILDRVYVEHTRDHLIKISESLRNDFGEDVLAKTIAHDVQEDSHQLIVVDGIRRMADIAYLQAIPGFVLVDVSADPRIRYERLIARSENADDQKKTYEQFLADHERSTELSILEVIQHSTEHIDNNGDKQDLHRQLTTLIERYGVTH